MTRRDRAALQDPRARRAARPPSGDDPTRSTARSTRVDAHRPRPDLCRERRPALARGATATSAAFRWRLATATLGLHHSKGGSLMAIRKRGKGRWQVRVRPFPEITVPTKEAARDGRARPEAPLEARPPLPREAVTLGDELDGYSSERSRWAAGAGRSVRRSRSSTRLRPPLGAAPQRSDPEPSQGHGRGSHRRARSGRTDRRAQRTPVPEGVPAGRSVSRTAGRRRHLRDRADPRTSPLKARHSSSRTARDRLLAP